MEIFTILFILGVVYGVGLLFEKLGQPLILGELLAGLIIGPSVFGLVGEAGQEGLIGTPIFEWTTSMNTLATLGMFFLMFYAGLASDPKILGKMKKTILGVGILGTLLPLVFGITVGLYFTNNFWQATFLAIAISGTSLVTKARILDDLGILRSKIGHTMIGGAMIDNILSFIILAVVLNAATTGTIEVFEILKTLIVVAAFFEIALFLGYRVFPWARKLFAHPGARGFTFALVMGLLIASIGELIGLHFIIGAYLAGLFVREEFVGEAFKDLNKRFQTLSQGFLGPIFITSIAFHVRVEVLWTYTPFLIALLLAATFGKLLGAGGGGYLTGLKRREALIVGIGMNGRGTVELILALIGAGIYIGGAPILSDVHVSLLVFTSFVTTLTVPIVLKRLCKKRMTSCRFFDEETLV